MGMFCEEIFFTQHPSFFLGCWKKYFNYSACKQRGTHQTAQPSRLRSTRRGSRQKPCHKAENTLLQHQGSTVLKAAARCTHQPPQTREPRPRAVPYWQKSRFTHELGPALQDLCCLLVSPLSWAPAGHMAMTAGYHVFTHPNHTCTSLPSGLAQCRSHIHSLLLESAPSIPLPEINGHP